MQGKGVSLRRYWLHQYFYFLLMTGFPFFKSARGVLLFSTRMIRITSPPTIKDKTSQLTLGTLGHYGPLDMMSEWKNRVVTYSSRFVLCLQHDNFFAKPHNSRSSSFLQWQTNALHHFHATAMLK